MMRESEERVNALLDLQPEKVLGMSPKRNRRDDPIAVAWTAGYQAGHYDCQRDFERITPRPVPIDRRKQDRHFKRWAFACVVMTFANVAFMWWRW